MKSPYVYISGSLTVMQEDRRKRLRSHYELLAAIVERNGYGAYLPHKFSDPTLNAQMTPAEVDVNDRTAVMRSALVLAEVTVPAIGVGIEVEMAYHANIPVVLFVKNGERISRLVEGNPAVVAVIRCNPFTPDAAEQAIHEELERLEQRPCMKTLPGVLVAQLRPVRS